MFQKAPFQAYFLGQKLSPNSCNTYVSYLGRLDALAGGLDEKLSLEGADQTRAWLEQVGPSAFGGRTRDAVAALNKYVGFVQNSGRSLPELVANDDESDGVEQTDVPGALFRLERDMQAAVRRQLDMLEPGLKQADGGMETTVDTGRIDILAEDRTGNLVVIELKAGSCPAGAMEQALGYAEDISREHRKPVRVFLIASDFSDRIRSAAKRVQGLELHSYSFALTFGQVV